MASVSHRSPSPRHNLIEAMKEQAFAFAQSRVLAREARKRGYRKLAAFLKRTAEQHYLKCFAAGNELLRLSVNKDRDIGYAIREESLVVEIICKIFAREAKQRGDIPVARLLTKMRLDEKRHRMRLDEL